MAEKTIVAVGSPTEDEVRELGRCALDFRAFLRHWRFRDTETGKVRVLGEVLWEAQEEFVAATRGDDWIFFLKARKLGETTIECAYDGWVARFRQPNARVHMWSRRDLAAQDLLREVRFGLSHLPVFMRLPFKKDNASTLELDVPGRDDVRVLQAYPADEDTAVEATCVHGHVDEWARMRNPRRVWQAIEPSMAGTCHIVTTGMGPQNYSSDFYRRCLSGDIVAREGRPMRPLFIGALKRPDRNDAWYRAKARSMPEDDLRKEYPLSWEDALTGGGEQTFSAAEVDAAGADFRGVHYAARPPAGAESVVRHGYALPALRGRCYVKAWDIGRHKDAAVGVVLDVTEDVHDVVDYRRLREATYPTIQREIEAAHAEWPGPTVVERNSAGEAVLENLDIPESELEGFTTSKPSKARIIGQLKLALQNQLLRWDPDSCHQLDSEMRGYQEPDDNVVQDSVMALAIGVEFAPHAHRASRVLDAVYV